jgi:hypothetical protein
MSGEDKMKEKPSLTKLKKNRLKEAKDELDSNGVEMKQTTVVIDAKLLYAAKNIALQRKISGVEPSTITGMIRDALKEIVRKGS